MIRVPRDENGRVASPCRRQCTLNQEDICVGCFRSLTEICDWSKLTDDAREQVLERCHQRAQQSPRGRR